MQVPDSKMGVVTNSLTAILAATLLSGAAARTSFSGETFSEAKCVYFPALQCTVHVVLYTVFVAHCGSGHDINHQLVQALDGLTAHNACIRTTTTGCQR